MLFWTEWWPLTAEAVQNLSDIPGLYEVKVERRLVDYPAGRSAMIYYGITEKEAPSLKAIVARDWLTPEKEAIRRNWEAYGPLVFRWAATPDPQEEHERRVRLFRERFGRSPWGNTAE